MDRESHFIMLDENDEIVNDLSGTIGEAKKFAKEISDENETEIRLYLLVGTAQHVCKTDWIDE